MCLQAHPGRCFFAREFGESLKMGKQMTAIAGAPIGSFKNWKSIHWPTVYESVKRLQMRIAKAVKEGRFGRVKALQWLLTHSYHAKLLAVKRVTSNKGKRTSGVDNVIWKTPRQKFQAISNLKRKGYHPLPLRRIYIPKKNGKKRPLSIPVMTDRAMQALYKLALEPIAETLADPNSYGFRSYRRCADAIAQCFITLAKKASPVWVLEADIKACFDEISHDWLIDYIPMDKRILTKWLKSGFMEDGKLFPTGRGTPQGGIASPILANMVLDGIERTARSVVPARCTRNGKDFSSKINVIRYADDFIITGATRELLVNKVKPAIVSFLSERGLSLSEEKTLITRIDRGFNFLGQNVRKYNGTLLIKPSRKNVQAFIQTLHETFRKHRGSKTEALIRDLNMKIRGWANYHKHVVSSKTFGYIDTYVWNEAWQWVKRRHRNKSIQWLKNKYWSKGSKPGRFATVVKDKNGNPRTYELIKAHSIHIQRHIKIRGDANPFDPEHQQYFRVRRVKPKAIPVSVAEEICSGITVNFTIGKRKTAGQPRKASP
jgi:RNA-directed DNA polymerase